MTLPHLDRYGNLAPMEAVGKAGLRCNEGEYLIRCYTPSYCRKEPDDGLLDDLALFFMGVRYIMGRPLFILPVLTDAVAFPNFVDAMF